MAGARQTWVPQGVASSAIAPSVFAVASSNNQYATAGAGATAIGATDSSTRGPDAASEDIHAAAGEEVRFQAGNVVIVVTGTGGTTAGTPVMSDAAGLAVDWVTANASLGVALQTVAAGGEAEIYFAPGIASIS